MKPLPHLALRKWCAAGTALAFLPSMVWGQTQYTTGFQNAPRAEAPGTLLSAPFRVTDNPTNGNDSESLGRTTTINYVNGWLMVGGEAPGSQSPYDLNKRVYDISNPEVIVRKYPADFGLTYPSNRWLANTDGWNAHGSAQSGPYLLPLVMRVQQFGGAVELGGQDGIPQLSEMPLLYNRSGQAGPWDATMLWYGTPNQTMEIRRPRLNLNGIVNDPGDLLASFDHVGNFGGGDWHPMFFGDLLIYARSGAAANDGVVVYRLEYQDFDDADPLNDTVTPHFVSSLQGGFNGYWPNLFSDGSGLYVIGSATNILTSADITSAANPSLNPGGEVSITQGPTLTIPNFTNASYPVYQDQYAFIHNRKINMTQFLAGQGMNSIALTLDETGTGVDTTQMSLPLGNLWITGGYPNGSLSQGMAIWVHQSEPDTTQPTVTYHIPQANRSDYPRFAPLSFMLHEHPRHGGLRNGIDFTVRPVQADGTSLGPHVQGYLIHDAFGVLTFTPTGGLADATTYQVDFLSTPPSPDDLANHPENGVGFADAAGNYIEPYTFRFSTGADVETATPPVITSLTSSTYQPAPTENFTITTTAVLGTGNGPLSYRFNFEGTWSDWGASSSAVHQYPTAGRSRVLVQVRDGSGNRITQPLNLLVMDPPVGPAPTQSSPMAMGDDPGGRRLWTVNPDANTVTVVDPADGQVVAEYPVGENPRSIARDALGNYWVTCLRSDEIRVLSPAGASLANLTLPYGSAPYAVAASPDGQSLFVSMSGSGRLHRYTAANLALPPTIRDTFPTPRAIAISGDGSRVLVTRFISPELRGEIAEFAGNSPALDFVRLFALASANPNDSGDRASGVPNYLAGISISPDGARAAVVSKQDNIQRGLQYGVPDLTFETTVRSVISFLNLTTQAEIADSRRDFDNSDSPSAVAYTPLGDTLLVTLQGNNRVVGIDALNLAPVTGWSANQSTLTSPAIKTLEAAAGLAPQGIIIDPASGRICVQNFMGRSVTLLDAAPFLNENRNSLTTVANTETVGNELLSATELNGKRIFYNAADPRMSADGYISCASCHVDGGHDGRVWDFTGRGEGLRRTTDLRGHSGTGHGNVHWSGNFDEIQDFEHDVRGPFGGTGFIPMSAQDFAIQHPSPSTGKAGLNADLDALAAYVTSLGHQSVPRSPYREANGNLTAAAIRGRDVFTSRNCASCHSGNSFTNSEVSPVDVMTLQDVGTTSILSGQRLGGTLAGIDTPSLLGLHASRTFLHHGQAKTLEDVFGQAGGNLHLAVDAELVGGAAVSIESETPFQGGGGFLRGALGGACVNVYGVSGNGVRFNAVDGGSEGGAARVSIRHILRGAGSTRLLVNGVEQTINLLGQFPDNGWQTSGWRTIQADIPLLHGPNNTIEIFRGSGEYANFQLNSILVSNADDITAAQPHQSVRTLPPADADDLIAYLNQLDGSPGEAPVPFNPDNPAVTLTALPDFGLPLTVPYIDYDVVFSSPVTGLIPSDFIIGGSAGASLTNLTNISGGSRYRLRIAGFAQPGTLTVQLPAGVVDGAIPGTTNNASALSEIDYTLLPNDIAGLSDEFGDPATLSQWQRNNATEGWNADKLEQWDIATTTAGHMRLMPYSSSWYQDFTGAYAYKEVTGDFVLTTRLDVARRNGQAGRPTSDYSLTGLMVRASRGITQAAPQPDPGPGVVLPWPLPGGTSSDWLPGTENYVFLSFGFGNNGISNNPNLWQYEVKTTINGVSTLYPRAYGVPENEGNATLQIARRGSDFLLLRRHGSEPWIVENHFSRPDLPATLQVGLTTYTDWNTVSAGWNYVSPVEPFHQNRIVNSDTNTTNPDMVADVDYFRLQRPHPELNATAFQTAAVTGPDGPVSPLAGTALAPYLGDAANSDQSGQTYGAWLLQHFTPEQLANPNLTSPASDPDHDNMPNLIDYLTDGNPGGGDPSLRLAIVSTSGSPLLTVGRNPLARGFLLIIEATEDFIGWSLLADSVDGGLPGGPGFVSETPGVPRTMTLQDIVSGGPRRFYRVRAVPD